MAPVYKSRRVSSDTVHCECGGHYRNVVFKGNYAYRSEQHEQSQMHQAFLLTGKKSERTLAKEEKEKADKLAKARENKFECKCGSFYPQTQRGKYCHENTQKHVKWQSKMENR